MAKSFKNTSPIEKLSGATPVETNKETKVEEPKEKRKVGRPKTKIEDTKTINIAVPVSVLEKLDTVKVCYGNNLTQYINKLIENDIEANFDKYKSIADSLNSFK